jgi:glycosyltransferase involved in cell wall biosynthesis
VEPASTSYDVVFLGRLISEKRVDQLLRAIALLRTERPDFRCIVIGEGPARADLERLASELGLGESVHFAGFLEERDALQILKAAKTCVMPSEREGFGIVVLESQALGVPVVVATSPESAAADLVDHGRTGLLCDPSPEGLSQAIQSLLTNETLSQAISNAALEESAKFDWNEIAAAMEAVYWTAARRKSHGRSVQGVPGHGGGEPAEDPVVGRASTRR